MAGCSRGRAIRWGDTTQDEEGGGDPIYSKNGEDGAWQGQGVRQGSSYKAPAKKFLAVADGEQVKGKRRTCCPRVVPSAMAAVTNASNCTLTKLDLAARALHSCGYSRRSVDVE